MNQPGRELVRPNLRWSRVVRLAFLRRLLRLLWRHVIVCSSCADGEHPLRYRRLREAPPSSSGFLPEDEEGTPVSNADPPTPPPRMVTEEDSDDLVSLKVSLLGDCLIGKTSFMVKYVGEDEEHQGLQMTGLNLMDKVFFIRGMRIAFSIWDVGGDRRFLDHIPLACKDAAAILIMFDLTNRSTLCNAIYWYRRARKWNKTGIPILIGTKFDDFVELPLEIQWTIVHELSTVVSIAASSTTAFNNTLQTAAAAPNRP